MSSGPEKFQPEGWNPIVSARVMIEQWGGETVEVPMPLHDRIFMKSSPTNYGFNTEKFSQEVNDWASGREIALCGMVAYRTRQVWFKYVEDAVDFKLRFM